MKRLTQVNWQKIVKRRAPLLTMSTLFEGATFNVKKYIGISLNTNLVAGERQHQVATDQGKLVHIGRAVLRRAKGNPRFAKQHSEDCFLASEKLLKVAKSAAQGDLQSLSDDTLLRRFRKWADMLKDFTVFLYIPHSVENVIGERVEELYDKRNYNNVSLADLLITSQYPESTLEQHELVDLACEVKGGNTKNYKYELNKHYRKYRWLTMFAMNDKPATLSYFKNRLNDLLKTDLEVRVDEIEKNKREIRKVNKFIKKNLRGELLRLLSMLRKYIYLRNYRAEMWAKAHFYVQPFLKEIARRSKLSLTQLCYLTELEVVGFIKNRNLPSKSEINRRVRAYALMEINGKYSLFSGRRKMHEVITKEFGGADVSKIREFKGTVACRGHGKGKARVILDVDKAGTLKRGEILVAIMTKPEYVVAMEKCAAIVTDEGGILCHAAIVSREMNIPCVIGTKIATKVLKTGDLVEVDAEKGIVRKLDR